MIFSTSITKKVLEKICGKFKVSLFYTFFLKISKFIIDIYNRSLIKKYIHYDFCLNSLWEKSFIAKAFDITIIYFTKVIVFFGDFIKGKFAVSFINKVCKKYNIQIRVHYVMGFFIGTMFLINSDKWKNIYVVFFSVIFSLFLIYKRKSNEFKFSKMDFFLILFLISIPLGIISSLYKIDSIRMAMLLIAALLLMFIVTFFLDKDKKVIDFIRIVLAFILFTAIFAIIQKTFGLVNVNKVWVDINVNSGMPARVFSTMENPNNYAFLLSLFIPFGIALFITEKKFLFKIFWFFTTVVSIAALAMTYSRSCYVALFLSISVFLLIYNYKLIFPAIISGLLLIPLIPASIINRIFTIGSTVDTSNLYRLYVWDTCVELVKKYFITGIGIGPNAFSNAYKPLAHTGYTIVPHTHMLYLKLILENGIIGFVGFIAFYVRVVRKGLKNIKNSLGEQKVFLAAGIGSLVGICFTALVDDIWYYPRCMFAFFIVIGIVCAIIKNIESNKEDYKNMMEVKNA